MDIISDAIINYLQFKQSDYALLVNGHWGTGKTFLFKNKVIPDIINNTKFNNKSFFNGIYISLYGVSSVDDIDLKLFLELNPFWKNKWVKVGSNIGKLITNQALKKFGLGGIDDKSIQDGIKVLNKRYKSNVLVFDDLERANSKLLPNILGYLNQLTEHDGVKVIVLSNESEVDKNSNEDYQRIKEKVFRYTIQFKPAIIDSYIQILEYCSKNKDFHSFILSQKDFVMQLLEKTEHKNLRTLNFIFSSFERIFIFTTKSFHDNSYYNSLLLKLFLFFCAFSIELKKDKNNLKELLELSNWSSRQPADFSNFNIRDIVMSLPNKNESENDSPKEFKDAFSSTYVQFFKSYYNEGFEYFHSVEEYIVHGFLDEDLLKKELHETVDHLESIKVNDENRLYHSFINSHPYFIEDSELDGFVEQLLKYVEKGAYPISSYIYIYNRISWLCANGFSKLNLEDVSHIILKGLTNAKDISRFDSSLRLTIETNKDDLLYTKIRNKILELNEELISDEYKGNAEELESLYQDDFEVFYQKIKEGDYNHIPIFIHFSPTKTLSRYLKLTNSDKMRFIHYFENRYKSYDNSEEYSFLNDLHNEIDSVLSTYDSNLLSFGIHKKFREVLTVNIQNMKSE
jgi:hypothetical protein